MKHLKNIIFKNAKEGLKYLENKYELLAESHADVVRAVAVTYDNKYIISGSLENTLRVWNLQEKRQETVMRGHASYVTSIAITNNKYVISGSNDKTVRVWSLQKKCQEAVLQGHTNSVTSVAITNDNKQIVSGSSDRTVRIWNIQEKLQEAVLKGHTSDISTV